MTHISSSNVVIKQHLLDKRRQCKSEAGTAICQALDADLAAVRLDL